MMRIQFNRKNAAVVASIGLALLATSALAGDKHQHGSTNASLSVEDSAGDSAGGMMGGGMMGGDMMSRMKKMHSMMHGDSGGDMMGGGMNGGGMMGGDMMGGGMGGGGMMGGNMSGGGMMGGDNPSYDSNGDGTTSVEELREGLLTELTDFDSDSNGFLDIGEFEELNAARIRNQMVDRFQALDEDGDGQVTKDEMTAPADKMQMRMDRQAKSGMMQGKQGMQGMQGGAMQPPADDKE